VLSHFGTTSKATGSAQRNSLENHTLDILSKIEDEGIALGTIAEYLVGLIFSKLSSEESSCTTSDSIYACVLSLIKTLGIIGGTYDPEFEDDEDLDTQNSKIAWSLCVQELAPKLSKSLLDVLKDVEALSKDNVGLYQSFPGKLYSSSDRGKGQNDNGKTTKSKKGSEEEEWEKQVKQEIALKKAAENKTMTEDDMKLLQEQTSERLRMRQLIEVEFYRSLKTIETLCLSDIEVGNSILPVVTNSVVTSSISKCEAMESLPWMTDLSFQTLCSLASCVYEIEEMYSTSVAKSLLISSKVGDAPNPLPSPCPPAASTITEVNDFGDCLSGNSFTFLFPILRSALTGPRTTSGCEDALLLLDRHSELIANNEAVAALRKDMAFCSSRITNT